MHRYSFPISVTLEGGIKTAGTFIVTGDEPLDPAEQERRRVEYEKVLNEGASNPLLPGAQYTLGLPQYRKLRK